MNNHNDSDHIATIILRSDYRTFAEYVFRHVAGESLPRDPYVGVICKAAIEIFNYECLTLVLNMPPRHGKTLLFTIALAAWELGHRPEQTILILTHSEAIAKDISSKIRDITRLKQYRRAFPRTTVRAGHDRLGDFATTAGGGVIARHLSGNITGLGGALIVVDDPLPITAADNPKQLAATNDLYARVVANRFNTPSKARLAAVGHRLHRNDLHAVVLREEGCRHVVLGLVAEQDESHAMGGGGVWHRRKGEVLRAGEFSAKKLARLREQSDFASLYQQRPEGEVWWSIEPADLPPFDLLPADVGAPVLSIDTGHAPGTRNSCSVIQVWQSTRTHHFCVHQARDQFTPDQLFKAVRKIIKEFRPRVILIEDTDVGIALPTMLRRLTDKLGIIVVPVQPPRRGKLARLGDYVKLIKSRRVLLARDAPWASELRTEVCVHEGRTDQIDALTMYLAYTEDNPPLPSRPATPGSVGVVQNARGVRRLSGEPPPFGAPRGHVFARPRR